MKHRKKHNAIQKKQESQHQRNLFYKKMQQTMALIGDTSAFALLKKDDLAFMHYTRIRPHKIIAAGNSQLKSLAIVLDILNTTLNNLMHKSFIEVGEHKIRVSLYDFGVFVETLYMFWRNIDTTNPDIALRFRSCFPLFNDDFNETRVQVQLQVIQKLEIISWLYSDLTKQMIRFVPVEIKKSSSAFSASLYYNNYIMEEKPAETETFETDGNNRTIYRVYATKTEGFTPLTITPEKLGMEGIMQKFPLKVFIQMHVFERIETRLGKLFRMFHFPFIFFALLKAETIPTENKNSFLFPVTNNNTRLGYLKGDVIGDKLLIRTFLFVTNNGTPEGKKLNHLIGLQKADKKYLGIDKLSTFIQSDIKNDEKLKALFYEAGCSGLFNLDKTLLDEPGDKELAAAGFIAHYLGL